MTLEYKDASPEQTIQKIKNILKDIGINTKELGTYIRPDTSGLGHNKK